MLDEKMLEQFKLHLQSMRDELLQLEQTGVDAAQTVELDQTRVGRLSRMDALQGQAMSQALNERRKQELQKISVALRRIGDGEYGYCLKCGEEIAMGRLESNPATPLCIHCAS